MTRSVVRRPGSSGLLVLALLVVVAAEGVWFALAQEVWIDESTQLSGAALPLPDLFRWLAGTPYALGVPPDRMPPLSYLLDSLLLRAGGASVLAVRLAHLLVVLVGLGVLLRTLGRRLGTVAMVAAGVVLALSPALVQAAVEVRAYPLLIAVGALLLALALSCTEELPTRQLVAFVVLGVVAGYAHFFGIVATSAVALGLFVVVLRGRGRTRLVGGVVVVALAWAGLVPFVTSSAAVSRDAQSAGVSAGSLAHWALTLLAASPDLVHRGAGLALLAGLAALLVVSAARTLLVVRRGGWRGDPVVLLWAVAVAGGLATIAAAFLAHGFDALKPSYSLWLLPVVAALVGSALAPPAAAERPRAGRRPTLVVVAVAALVALLGGLVGQAELVAHRSLFAHGPLRTLTSTLEHSPRGTAVVYVGSQWAYGFYPLHWQTHAQTEPTGRVDQLLLDPRTATVRRIGLGGHPEAPRPVGALDRYPALLVVRVQTTGYQDLADQGPYAEATARQAGRDSAVLRSWSRGPVRERPGLYWTTTQLLTRR